MVPTDARELEQLVLQDGLTEAVLLDALARRIGDWLVRDGEALWQALYRLDVPEAAAHAALNTAAPAPALARLVVARVREKAAARARMGPQKPPPDDELAW